MNIHEKLLQIQIGVDQFIKDGENKSDKYNYVSSDMVLSTIRPMMNELKLLLVPRTLDAKLHTGETKSGTTRYMTELFKEFLWIDCESGEQYAVPFYAQGVDLAGEKGVGKAETYAEKYFLLKFFHVPTSRDDPDSDGKTGKGEKKQRGTQAQKETLEYQRAALAQMASELCGGDDSKIAQFYQVLTRAPSGDFEGVTSLDAISDAMLPVAYGKSKATYKKKNGRDFVFSGGDDSAD